MDIGSIVALAIVLVLFAVVVVGLVRKSRRGGGCVDCSDEGCAFRGTTHEPVPGATMSDGTLAHCPSMQRALAAVEEHLGPAPSAEGTAERSDEGPARPSARPDDSPARQGGPAAR